MERSAPSPIRLSPVPQPPDTNGNQWGLSYLYDCFGNHVQQNVTKARPGFTPPSSNLFVDMNTNRVNSWTYDANGNAANIPGVGKIAFDWNNRVTTVGSESYVYNPGHKRLCKNSKLTLWGGRGEEVGRFELQWLQDSQWALKFKHCGWSIRRRCRWCNVS